METHVNPSGRIEILSHPSVQKYLIEQANRLFDGAYETLPFSRITIPDLYELITNPDVKSGLFCFSGLNGDALVGSLFQWNKQREEAASRAGSVLGHGGFNPSDTEDELSNISEFYLRPRKEPDPEAEFDL